MYPFNIPILPKDSNSDSVSDSVSESESELSSSRILKYSEVVVHPSGSDVLITIYSIF